MMMSVHNARQAIRCCRVGRYFDKKRAKLTIAIADGNLYQLTTTALRFHGANHMLGPAPRAEFERILADTPPAKEQE